MVTLTDMYNGQANSPAAIVAAAIDADDTTITVDDASILPEATTWLTLGADTETAETVKLTNKAGNDLIVTRAQDGTTAKSWGAGATIQRCFTAADHNALIDNIEALNSGKLEKPTSSTSGNLATFDASGEVADSGKKASDFATASHVHSGYAQIKVFSSVAVASAAWSSDATYAAFPYSATITASGVTSDMVPEVNFGLTEAASGNFAPVALSGSGTIKIYAAVAPSAAITIPSITCVKAVS